MASPHHAEPEQLEEEWENGLVTSTEVADAIEAHREEQDPERTRHMPEISQYSEELARRRGLPESFSIGTPPAGDLNNVEAKGRNEDIVLHLAPPSSSDVVALTLSKPRGAMSLLKKLFFMWRPVLERCKSH